jgi:hypothetical protein
MRRPSFLVVLARRENGPQYIEQKGNIQGINSYIVKQQSRGAAFQYIANKGIFHSVASFSDGVPALKNRRVPKAAKRVCWL